ncbi:hypothetical protein KI387_043594, partial [Taxus chinensis]
MADYIGSLSPVQDLSFIFDDGHNNFLFDVLGEGQEQQQLHENITPSQINDAPISSYQQPEELQNVNNPPPPYEQRLTEQAYHPQTLPTPTLFPYTPPTYHPSPPQGGGVAGDCAIGSDGAAAFPSKGKITLRYKCGAHPKKPQPFA